LPSTTSCRPYRVVGWWRMPRSIEVQKRVYAAFAQTPPAETNTRPRMTITSANSFLATLDVVFHEMGNLCSALGVVTWLTSVSRPRGAVFHFDTRGGRRVRRRSHRFFVLGLLGLRRPLSAKTPRRYPARPARGPTPDAYWTPVIRTNLQRACAHDRPADAISRRSKTACHGARPRVQEDTDDMSRVPAIPIVQQLVERGARLRSLTIQSHGNSAPLDCRREIRFGDNLAGASPTYTPCLA